MENFVPIHFQEIIYSSSDKKVRRQIATLERTGKIKKIAPRIFTSNFIDTDEVIIKRNIFSILGNLYPGALLSHRSAIEFKPTITGQVFVTYTYTKKIALPGIIIHFMEGIGAIEGDNSFSGKLFVSQQERAFLENLQPSRKTSLESKTISIAELENKLENIVQVKGEYGLNQIRDNAKVIADSLGMQNEFGKLNKIISALLSTQPSKILSSPRAIARAFGNPYDQSRIDLFELLFQELKQNEFKNVADINTTNTAFQNFAFYESYFSNYIEGTRFEVVEAKNIIETDTPMVNRDEDSHDILGTYKLVSNKIEMTVTPTSPEAFISILQYRHRLLLAARLSKMPGVFKDKNNRAGETFFVDFQLVKGTLIKGFDFYKALTDPFAKAAYIMFMVSEIHPFLDGNGRVARVMMNAELVKADQTRIIIPTVYREDYLGALRKLTRQQNPIPYVKMLQRAQDFSATLNAASMEELEVQLISSNAFKEQDEAKLKFVQ
jgi:fido (protein-threonine AMPylation protein)